MWFLFLKEAISLLCAIHFLLAGVVALAMVQRVPLEQLTQYATQIVIGKVIAESEHTREFWIQPGTGKSYEFLKATIHVDSVIRGDKSIDRIQVYYLTIGDSFGELIPGRPSVFFINDGKDDEPPWNKPIVMTTTGDVPIEGEWVLTGRIKDEPKRQTLESFVAKIKGLLSGGGK
jgi:hypothetical protein